jgi:superfamily II DNA/RNA helicase
MTESVEQLEGRLAELISPRARYDLLARGLARGLIWEDGKLPPESPEFSPDLSSDLLDHGYGVLSRALRLREMRPESSVLADAFRVASEAIESQARKGDSSDPDRGFQLLVAAMASHLGGFAARAFSLMDGDAEGLNLSSDERLLSLAMRHALPVMRDRCVEWLEQGDHQDEAIASRLNAPEADFEVDDALELALRRNIHQAAGLVDSALALGDGTCIRQAVEQLMVGRGVASEAGFVPAWWVHVLFQHLIEELWDNALWTRLPSDESWDSLRRDFIELLGQRDTAEITVWPSQLEAAARAVDSADDLVVALPTSAGKTRIAELCILRALADGKRVVYVTPLRALSAQQERTLSRTFRPLGARVSSLYGASGVARADVATLQTGSIVVATPEKLDFALRHQPSLLDDVGLIVLDEGHMIGISEREVRYEALVQRLLSRADADQRRLVCLSAIFGAGELTADFTSWIRSDQAGGPIESQWRPTRHRPATLVWDGTRGRLEVRVEGERPFVPAFIRSRPPIAPRRNPFPHDHVEVVLATADALAAGGANVLVYCPQRSHVESVTTRLLELIRRGFLKEYPVAGPIRRAQRIGEEWLGSVHPAVTALAAGIAVHHGGLPRAFLNELERLLASRALRYAIASPTVAQGLDLSASALVFHSLYRAGQPIDGEEYRNVIGRVGRAFVDLDGLSVLPLDRTEQSFRRKLELYEHLVTGQEQRVLESGIALLIDRLISLVEVNRLISREEAVEYLVGQQGSWSPSEEPPEEFTELLANLDSALLSTIEDLETPVDALADVLDSALRNSLWRRTLSRMPEPRQDQQRRVLLGRARWLWEHTDPPSRRGFFASGVGYHAGNVIRENVEELASTVSRADRAIVEADIELAAALLARVEEVFSEVHPFGVKKRPEGWEALIHDWIAGESVVRVDAESIEFVQDGLVYRLVWAVEAVRAYAEAIGMDTAGEASGRASLALTYGVPSLAASLLIRLGLPSRRLAVDIAHRFSPPEGASVDDDAPLRDWVDELSSLDPQEMFSDPLDASLWTDFVSPTTQPARRWSRTQSVVEVVWHDTPPSPGTQVRLVHRGEATKVCALDLTTIGSVALPLAHVVRAVVRADGHLDVERFGPPS